MPTAVGVDLGTTNSVVAVLEAGEPAVVPHAEGGRTTPCVVGFSETGEVLVGELAERPAVTSPDRTIRSAKRRTGRSWSTGVDAKRHAAQELSARIQKEPKRDAEAYRGEPVTQAVTSVPAYVGDAQRTATPKGTAAQEPTPSPAWATGPPDREAEASPGHVAAPGEANQPAQVTARPGRTGGGGQGDRPQPGSGPGGVRDAPRR